MIRGQNGLKQGTSGGKIPLLVDHQKFATNGLALTVNCRHCSATSGEHRKCTAGALPGVYGWGTSRVFFKGFFGQNQGVLANKNTSISIPKIGLKHV